MTGSQRETLWRQLSDLGLVQGALPERSTRPSPWYVRAMLGVAGWIGALFILSFIGAAFSALMSNGAGLLIAGALLCGAAAAVFRMKRDNDFIAQFGLAVSLTGQLLFVMGLFDVLDNRFSFPLHAAIALFELALVALVPHFVHRVWSTLAACVAVDFALSALGVRGVSSGMAAAAITAIWLGEPRWIRASPAWRPIGYGVTFALLWFDATLLTGDFLHSIGDAPARAWNLDWIGPVLVSTVLIVAVRLILTANGVPASGRIGILALATTAVVAVSSVGAPGVTSGILILLLGFAVGARVLCGVGVLALLGYLAYFYYSLHTTLLVKSGILVATGVVLIASWALMQRLLRKELTHA